METPVTSKPVPKKRVLTGTALAVILGAASFGVLQVTAADEAERRIDETGETASQECVDGVAEIADEQAELFSELGPDAPKFDFRFPEASFD